MADIELRNLTKRFGKLIAVDSVDLDVEAGEVMCLLGPSGCGKTTTLRMIGGLEWASEGDIFIAGKRVNNLKPAQRDIAMVFQFYALYPSLTVAENLAFPLHAEKIDKEEIDKRVTRIADILELSHAMGRIPGRLSEGEKQRVAVGRAVIRNPQCFLFDEPLSRLDIALRQEMRGQIKMLLADLNKASVIVTHDQIEALTIGDRIAVMRDGLIEQVASPHEIFASPANIFVAGFIGTPQMNLIAGRDLKPGDGGMRLKLCNQDITLPLAAAGGGGVGGSGGRDRQRRHHRWHQTARLRFGVGKCRRYAVGANRSDRADGRGDSAAFENTSRGIACGDRPPRRNGAWRTCPCPPPCWANPPV